MLSVPGVRPLWSSGTRSEPQPKLESASQGCSLSADAPAGSVEQRGAGERRENDRARVPRARYTTRPGGWHRTRPSPQTVPAGTAASAPVTLARRWRTDEQQGARRIPRGPRPTPSCPPSRGRALRSRRRRPPRSARSHVLTGALIAIGVAAVFVIGGVLLGSGDDTADRGAAAPDLVGVEAVESPVTTARGRSRPTSPRSTARAAGAARGRRSPARSRSPGVPLTVAQRDPATRPATSRSFDREDACSTASAAWARTARSRTARPVDPAPHAAAPRGARARRCTACATSTASTRSSSSCRRGAAASRARRSSSAGPASRRAAEAARGDARRPRADRRPGHQVAGRRARPAAHDPDAVPLPRRRGPRERPRPSSCSSRSISAARCPAPGRPARDEQPRTGLSLS